VNTKMCTCGETSRGAYLCARCNQEFCLSCDQPIDAEEYKTIVRYCPDWRCQREKDIENGLLKVVSNA
jgi:hypothetical protein